jgi:hypothetical protein
VAEEVAEHHVEGREVAEHYDKAEHQVTSMKAHAKENLNP